jgi:hypothetical protein
MISEKQSFLRKMII